MRFSSALISFLSSLPATSVAMAMEEPHDSVLHDVTASILEESLEVKYKNIKSHLEPLQIQNSNDGRLVLADDKGDVMQKKETIYHQVEHQQHQEGMSLEECNISPTTTTTTATAAAAAATTTSDNDSLMERKIFSDKESIKKMDYGHLHRGTCSSTNDACVPQNKATGGNGGFLEPEDASYASSGYCVPLSFLEGIEYKNDVTTTTLYLIGNEEFNKEEEMTDSYYHYHPQYDQYHRQLDSVNCDSYCSGERPDVSTYLNEDEPFPFQDLINDCYTFGVCPSDDDDISCWNTAGITDMYQAFSFQSFNAPLECWNVGQVTSMQNMFFRATFFNQPIDSWDVSKVGRMNSMFSGATYFNQPLDSWDVSQVETMSFMFSGANSFNQPIDSWDVSQVEYMSRMFSSATPFNQPIDSWDVSQVKDMGAMLRFATSFNQPLDSWNVSEVGRYIRYNYGSMRYMFFGASEFNQCLSTWAEKTYDYVDTFGMLVDTDCPNGIDNPDATIGPWCQNYTQGCFAPGFEPSQQPSDLPSSSPTTKSQKKKSIKKTKKQVKKKSKKM